ncbi:unnamed protein product [Brachionus calyciflorus]|uniref:Uncharacterized protein n=1 Tax=Brachionus calyciflorus TaxID=104777 RepID=A0A814MFY4_9BILA|nr:unnamed protein product [Brachionus calyciflorus]
MFLSGSSSGKLVLWQNTTVSIDYDSNEKNVKSIDSIYDFFLTAREENKIEYWKISFQTKVKESSGNFTKLRSVLIINETTCLIGYDKALSFLNLPQLEEKKKIFDENLDEIKSMKLLQEERIVLIGSSDEKIYVLSLESENITSFIKTEMEINALDSLNRNTIVSGCKSSDGKKDICSYYLNENNQLVKNRSAFVDEELTSGEIYSIEILDNNTLITGDECGIISFWNTENLEIVMTVPSSGKIYALRNIDFSININTGLNTLINVSSIDFQSSNLEKFTESSTEITTQITSSDNPINSTSSNDLIAYTINSSPVEGLNTFSESNFEQIKTSINEFQTIYDPSTTKRQQGKQSLSIINQFLVL